MSADFKHVNYSWDDAHAATLGQPGDNPGTARRGGVGLRVGVPANRHRRAVPGVSPG